jgi:type IV pilus assembly protein PilA
MTLVELMVVIVILLVLMVLAVGALRRARLSANETSAISTLRVVGQAQAHFAAACGIGGYTPNLATLGLPMGSGHETFLDSSLAVDPLIRSGFTFTMQTPGNASPLGRDCHGGTSYTRYYATARPTGGLVSGSRSFAMTEGASIWERTGSTPPAEPFGPPATLLK